VLLLLVERLPVVLLPDAGQPGERSLGAGLHAQQRHKAVRLVEGVDALHGLAAPVFAIISIAPHEPRLLILENLSLAQYIDTFKILKNIKKIVKFIIILDHLNVSHLQETSNIFGSRFS
jgi:hypothetical protein